MTDTILQTYLAEHDASCPSCAYNLRGLTGETCPECGSALRLQVGLVEQRVGALIGCFIAVSFAVGFDSFPWVLVLTLLGFEGISDLLFYFFWPAVIATTQCVCGLLVGLLLLYKRRAFLRWPYRRQVLAAWLLHGLNITTAVVAMAMAAQV